jgi:hypothetical protein
MISRVMLVAMCVQLPFSVYALFDLLEYSAGAKKTSTVNSSSIE